LTIYINKYIIYIGKSKAWLENARLYYNSFYFKKGFVNMFKELNEQEMQKIDGGAFGWAKYFVKYEEPYCSFEWVARLWEVAT